MRAIDILMENLHESGEVFCATRIYTVGSAICGEVFEENETNALSKFGWQTSEIFIKFRFRLARLIENPAPEARS